jgi:predicted PurR-regulated permease PerM
LWLPIGVLTGLLIAIPYLGFATGLIFALLAGMLQFGPAQGFLSVALIYGVFQVVESLVLTPRLVGERIGLHPLAVIFALIAFGYLFGFVGILLALPLAAVLAIALRRLRRGYLGSDFFARTD